MAITQILLILAYEETAVFSAMPVWALLIISIDVALDELYKMVVKHAATLFNPNPYGIFELSFMGGRYFHWKEMTDWSVLQTTDNVTYIILYTILPSISPLTQFAIWPQNEQSYFLNFILS